MSQSINFNSARRSGIELLKIIAMALIILSHSLPIYGEASLPSYINLTLSTHIPQLFAAVVIEHFGPLGNCIFIFCSAWFLVDSNKVKADKVRSIIFDCFTVSILYLFIYTIAGVRIGLGTLAKQILPTAFGNNWFIGCYLLMYAIHPFLNSGIRGMDQKTFLRFLCIAFLIYSMAYFVLHMFKDFYSSLLFFCLIYLLAAYIKLYMPSFQKNARAASMILITSCGVFLGLLIVLNSLGTRIPLFDGKMLYWDSIRNPFLLAIAVSLFVLFNRMTFSNTVINAISSVTLLIYVIHDNMLFKTLTKTYIWEKIYERFSYSHLVFWILIVALAQAVLATGLALAYKVSVKKNVDHVSRAITSKVHFLSEKALNRLIDIK